MAKANRKIAQPIGLLSALACLAIAFVRGGNPVAIKLVLRSLTPMQGAFARVAISCASIGLFALGQGTRLKPKRREIGPLCLLCAAYALQIGANQSGADLTSPVLVAMLFNTYPITANLVSSLVVPQDRLGPRRLAGLAIAFLGVGWVLSSETHSAMAPNPPLGNALVLSAATLLALRLVYVRQVVLRIDSVKAVFWPLLGSLPLFLLAGRAIPYEAERASADWTTLAALLFQGVVVGGAGQLAWINLIRRHTPATVTSFSFLTPVAGVAISSLFFAEPVPAGLVAGFVAVLAGIGLAVRPAAPATDGSGPVQTRDFGGTA